MQIVINKKSVMALPHPEKGTDYYFDTVLKGFGIRVGKKTKSFFADRWVGKTRARVKLGEFPHLSVEDARKQAIQTLGEMAAGINPNRRKGRVAPPLLEEVFDEFLTVRPLKPRSLHEYKTTLRRHLTDWFSLPVNEIHKDMVLNRHRKITGQSGEAQANQCMRYLRSVLNFAKARYDSSDGQPHLITNPVILALTETRSWHRAKRRQTVIPKSKLGAWFNAVLAIKAEKEDGVSKTICDYLMTCLLTGLRRQEAAQLKWETVDLHAGIITLPDTKNHQPHTLPLSGYLHTLFQERFEARSNDYVFPGREGGSGYIVTPQKTMSAVTQACGVKFCLHDLRRTFASIAEALGITGYTLKRLLNHQIQNDVTGGYIVAGYDTESLREPMQRISDFVQSEAKKDAVNSGGASK